MYGVHLSGLPPSGKLFCTLFLIGIGCGAVAAFAQAATAIGLTPGDVRASLAPEMPMTHMGHGQSSAEKEISLGDISNTARVWMRTPLLIQTSHTHLFGQTLIAKLMPRTFVALWMFWGALQECLTTQAYEEMANNTSNPVLAELCRRIAKQERRHFAYYFGQARKKLEGRSWAQRFVRWIAKRFYAPVGGGVKTDAEGARLVAQLFPGDRIFEVMSYIEKRMAQLPGMEGLDCCTRWAAKVQHMLPPETRASSAPVHMSAAA